MRISTFGLALACVALFTTAPAAGADPGPTAFRSPSGNIGCLIAGGAARCDIVNRTWAPPPAPPSCDTHVVGYGQGVEVDGSGPAHLVCAGDTALDPNAAVLAYGASETAGGFRCDSTADGMLCAGIVTGHGFFLSSQRYDVH